ncbi:MAG: PaaI family thioesterase [Methanomicrobiaceae archaeon]|nr:PaaI family thioesterase [Methanomicrobiaceae archaeon]
MTVRYLEEIRTRGRDANPFFCLMGIDVGAYDDGRAELSMQVRPDMLNGDGWLQGGVFASLCDEAMALALCTVLDERESIATISESTSFLRGVTEGVIVARGRVIRKGRRVAFTEGEVRMQGTDAPLLSQTAASFAVIRSREE